MGRFAVVGAEKCIAVKSFGLGFVARQYRACDVVYIRLVYDIEDIEGAADMGIERIPFCRPVYIVVTAASDVADLVQIFPVFKYSHQTGHVAFHAAFIKDIRVGKVVVGKRSVLVGYHNGDGALVFNIAAYPFVRQVAPYHAFFRGNVFIDSFGFSLCFSRSGGNGAFHHIVNRNGFDRIVFASAAKQHRRACKTGQKQYGQFFHDISSLSLFV